MELKSLVEFLESQEEFKEWKTGNKEFFLAHAFVMLDEVNKDTWQLGFYNKELKTMTTFIMEDKKLTIIPNQEILVTGKEISALKIESVKIPIENALTIAEEVRREKYSKEIVLKKFFIIQELDDKTIYNITFFTQSLKTINVKILSVDGKVLSHDLQVLADFSRVTT